MGRLIPHVQTDRAKEEEIRKTAERLRNQLDTDRSGQRAKQTLEFMDLAPLCDHWQWAKLGPLSRIYKADCARCFLRYHGLLYFCDMSLVPMVPFGLLPMWSTRGLMRFQVRYPLMNIAFALAVATKSSTTADVGIVSRLHSLIDEGTTQCG